MRPARVLFFSADVERLEDELLRLDEVGELSRERLRSLDLERERDICKRTYISREMFLHGGPLPKATMNQKRTSGRRTQARTLTKAN